MENKGGNACRGDLSPLKAKEWDLAFMGRVC